MTRRRVPAGSRGFSLFEVMIGAALLGIGILAATKLFTVSAQGSNWTHSRTVAMELAAQQIEMLATKAVTNLPACDGEVGCKLDQWNMKDALGDDGSGYPCTQYVAEAQTVGDGVGSTEEARYRIDTVVEAHPDTERQDGAQIVTMSICWKDAKGYVHEAKARKIVTPSS